MGKLTEDQKEFIRNNYLTMSNKKLANMFCESGISEGQIQYFLTSEQLSRGVSYKKNPIFSKDDILFIKNNYDKMTYKEISEILGFKERQIRSKAENLGLEKTRKINDHYFDKIDTPIKAYFLGYIFADGWIVSNIKTSNYEFGMELQSEDKYILEKLNNELGGLNIIKHNDPEINMIAGRPAHSNGSDVLRVYSKNLICGLMNNGISTNKTLKDICPQVEDEFFFDWLRGYIDGDGCFWKYKNNYYMHITCASEAVLKYVQSRLTLFEIETRIYKENDKKYRLMCVNIESMKKLVSRLYYADDLFCLSRKYEKVKYYLGFAA